jgi:hypothetical protein
MRNFLPMWFFKVFVMPYCYLMMLIGETISHRDRGFGLSEYEEQQFYNRYFHLCLLMGIITCAVVMYSITEFLRSII